MYCCVVQKHENWYTGDVDIEKGKEDHMTDPIMNEEVLRRVGETHLKLLYTIWEKKKR